VRLALLLPLPPLLQPLKKLLLPLLSLLPSLPPLPKARLHLQLNPVSVWHLPQNQKCL
jgi:hypothetical protein